LRGEPDPLADDPRPNLKRCNRTPQCEWKPYSAKSDEVIILSSPKPYMTTGYGKQTYPSNMKNDCAPWDKINVYKYGPGHTN
jgi:hypothetical protein